jgi:hypothetical protein
MFDAKWQRNMTKKKATDGSIKVMKTLLWILKVEGS